MIHIKIAICSNTCNNIFFFFLMSRSWIMYYTHRWATLKGYKNCLVLRYIYSLFGISQIASLSAWRWNILQPCLLIHMPNVSNVFLHQQWLTLYWLYRLQHINQHKEKKKNGTNKSELGRWNKSKTFIFCLEKLTLSFVVQRQ